MEFTQAPQSPFIPGTHIQWAWDSTSLGYYKECPRKYYYTMIEGWQPKSTSVHLLFGIYVHSALEQYDKLRAQGKDYDESVRQVVRDMLVLTKEWDSDNPNKNRGTLIRTIVWYLDNYRNDPAKTVILANGEAAVELSFRMELDIFADEDHVYTLCGHMDRLVEFNDSYYVMDRKTSKSTLSSYFFNGFSPDNQMSLYTFAGNVVYNTPVKGVIIDGIQVAVGFNEFNRAITMRTEAQLNEWHEDVQEIILDAERAAKRGRWPMNDKACHHYGGCPFRDVCSKDPSVREMYLKSDFIHRQWNPLETR